MIIGIAGRAGSGKDTVGLMMQHLLQYNWEIRKFAGALKHVCSILTGITDQDSRDSKAIALPWGITVRELQQRLGTEVVRSIHPDVWVDCIVRNYDTLQRNRMQPRMIITDVRFDNEVAAIRERGGIVFYVARPDNPYNDAGTEHSSEGLQPDELMPLILNDGSLDQLEDRVLEKLREHGFKTM